MLDKVVYIAKYMKDLLEKNNTLLKLQRIGDIVEGQVIGAGKSAIYVDLGAIGTGVIFGREFYQAKQELKKVKTGDKIFAKIVDLDNEDGYIELSMAQAGKEIGWDRLRAIKENNEIIKIKILGANKGGLIAEAEGIQGFLPVSQLAPENYPRVEGADKTKILQKLQQLIGKDLDVKIFDLNPQEDKLIFSEKATDTEKLKNILKNYKSGDVVEGEITGVVDFGAFMKFGTENLEGLIHISELDWQLIENPSEIVKVGVKVKAKIIEITEDGRVSLSLRALKKDPWAGIEEKYKKGDSVKGKVTKFNPFGAFVEIESKIQGLCHISEFGSQNKMSEQLQIGKNYKFQILQIDPAEHRMTLKLEAT